MLARMYGNAIPFSLARIRSRHLWLTTSKTGRHDNVGYIEFSSLSRAIRKHPDDGSIPGVGLGVVLGPLGVDGGLRPDI